MHEASCPEEPGALCGQLGYVVSRFKNLAFTGVSEVSTPHNILHPGPVTNLSCDDAVGTFNTLGRHSRMIPGRATRRANPKDAMDVL